jgi:hypothetical protein
VAGGLCVLYSRAVSSDVWVGAVTTLLGAVIGGAISFLLSQQQVKEARRQRLEDGLNDDRRRSADRRFQAYADFLTRARSFRNATEAYYLNPSHRPPMAELDALFQAANDASALVFLVVESEATYDGCRSTLRALEGARDAIHDAGRDKQKEPWPDLSVLLGQGIREFQNSARIELEVSGPTKPWNSVALPAGGT